MITVVNKYKHKPVSTDVYIGRPSPLSNQWTHRDGTQARYKVDSREIAIEKYREWIQQRIEKRDDMSVINELNRIALLAMKHDVNLICFCKPLPCHGDVLKEIIELKINK